MSNGRKFKTMHNGKPIEFGELTRVLIGTCVANDQGISSRQVFMKMQDWGFNVTTQQISTALYQLAMTGKIERVCAGVYRGV